MQAAAELTDAEIQFILGELGQCEGCGSFEDVRWEHGRTQYHTAINDNGPEDPNRDVALCRSCAKDHHEHWDSMWSDYYGGLL